MLTVFGCPSSLSCGGAYIDNRGITEFIDVFTYFLVLIMIIMKLMITTNTTVFCQTWIQR